MLVRVSSQLNITRDEITIWLMETTLENLENPMKKPLKDPEKSFWIFSGHPMKIIADFWSKVFFIGKFLYSKRIWKFMGSKYFYQQQELSVLNKLGTFWDFVCFTLRYKLYRFLDMTRNCLRNELIFLTTFLSNSFTL